jgi:hypothetical protein
MVVAAPWLSFPVGPVVLILVLYGAQLLLVAFFAV